ncbi:MAG: exodeoxyribonuclease VII small subunit [Treponema sp.]|jgi:exodeoxyribonuclease VII small subunit|nr:exodeoxyribonuclease VII small subunit [Treponema sp.]MBQ1592980.1 exodeoxyribonuclease VII small subunit [Treponema sp.]MBQ1643828.1 exodeoxyribonuclease VII small subunit [Treponema sp.]MBQ1670597.1 exodeoxyribonuclease VII small subunit [Treponema sp.]MBQ1714267.1 exodeoxyribonuclease VII small subunit [Treponema sp.]
MNNFEDDLKKLEELTDDIKRADISLEDALKDFEDGIKLAKSMKKTLDAMESKIQILMNSPETEDDEEEEKDAKPKARKSKSPAKGEGPVLDFFDPGSEVNGTRNA